MLVRSVYSCVCLLYTFSSGLTKSTHMQRVPLQCAVNYVSITNSCMSSRPDPVDLTLLLT